MHNSSSGWFAGRRRLLLWLSALLVAGTPAAARADCYGQIVKSCSAGELDAGTGVWCAGIVWTICQFLDPE